MGNYISSPQVSPQLLGISFIENYRFYFQNDKHINTSDVGRVFKSAFRQQKVSGEIMSLINNSDEFTKKELLEKLQSINEKYPGDPNVSRLSFDLVEVKNKLISAEQQIEGLKEQVLTRMSSSDYDEFVEKIKRLKHDRRQLENRLDILKKEKEELQISLYAARHTAEVLQEDNDTIQEENSGLNRENLDLQAKSKLFQSRINQLTVQINTLISDTQDKDDDITSLQKTIVSKDNQLRDTLYSTTNATKNLDSISNSISLLQEQLLLKSNEMQVSVEALDVIETTFSDLEKNLATLADTFEMRISQLEVENKELQQKLGL